MMAPTLQIPLRNIWLLFLYAADLAKVRDQFEGEIDEARDLPDLLGRILAHVVEERLRRNLSRGYRTRSQNLSRVRGRIDMLKTETGQLLERGQVACRFEAHTMNTPRNRVVKAALERLSARVGDDKTAHRCRALAADFSRVGVLGRRPSRTELATDQIGRNEKTDKLMLALASMVFDLVIPNQEDGDVNVVGAQLTEHLIRHLFEKAIGNALRLNLEPKGWRVQQGRRYRWPVKNASDGIASVLPGMQTDIELDHDETGRHIVIDTKFTNIFTSSNYRSEMLKSGYLYQLYAYLRTQENAERPERRHSEGMLLHPQIGGAVNEVMNIQGHQMCFRTIDLTTQPDAFEQALEALVA